MLKISHYFILSALFFLTTVQISNANEIQNPDAYVATFIDFNKKNQVYNGQFNRYRDTVIDHRRKLQWQDTQTVLKP